MTVKHSNRTLPSCDTNDILQTSSQQRATSITQCVVSAMLADLRRAVNLPLVRANYTLRPRNAELRENSSEMDGAGLDFFVEAGVLQDERFAAATMLRQSDAIWPCPNFHPNEPRARKIL